MAFPLEKQNKQKSQKRQVDFVKQVRPVNRSDLSINKRFNYENSQYLERLENSGGNLHSKYLFFIKKLLSGKKEPFLDVGFGGGRALKILSDEGYVNIYGCEISSLFLKAAVAKGLKNLTFYKGKNLIYKDNFFRVVGSFTVLEHVEDPTVFLTEQIRVTKPGGYIIVICPNFLNFFFPTSYRKLNKFYKRLFNIPKILKKLMSDKYTFEKLELIIRKDFQSDDDAVNLTNLIDIEKFFSRNNCQIVFSSGFAISNNFVTRLIESLPIVRYCFPSCFLVAKKNNKKI